MPNRTTRTSISVDVDLIEPAKERSRQFDRFGDVNLSAYINHLMRKDLGLEKEVFERRPGGAVLPQNPTIDNVGAKGGRKAAQNLPTEKEE